MAGRYPSSLDYVSNEMVSVRGVSTQMFKVQPSSGLGSYTSGQKIQFVLPGNSLMDVKSRIYFRVNCAGTGASIGQGVKSLFSRLEVAVGGISLLTGSNQFNIIEHVKAISGESVPDFSEHADMVQLHLANGHRRGTAGALEAEAYSENSGSIFSIDLGDFSTMTPRIIDTSLMSSITISLTLAGSEVLARCAGADMEGITGSGKAAFTASTPAAASFTINQCYLGAEVYSVNDGMYSALLQSRLANTGNLELRVEDSVVFEQNSYTGSLRAGLSAANITKLIGVFRQSTYSSQAGAVSVLGYDTLVANKFKSVVANGSKQQYVTRHQNLTAPIDKTGNANLYDVTNADCGDYDSVSTFPHLAFSINSAQLPMYAPTPYEWYELSKYAHDKKKFRVNTIPEWLQNKFFMSFQCDLPASGTRLTGIDTRAANSALSLDLVTGSVEAGFNCLFIIKKINTLIVGNGKSAEVIH